MGKYRDICAAVLIGLSVLGQPAWSEDSAPSSNVPPRKEQGAEKSPTAAGAKTEDSADKKAAPDSKVPDKASPEKTPAPDSTGKAPESPDAQTVTAPNTPPEWHRLQTRLSGSLCLACLKELGSNLQRVYGVQLVRVEKAPVQYNSSISPELGGWANGVIIYDAKKLPLDDLRSVIKQNGYHPFRVVDSYVEGPPSEAVLKFRR